VTAAMADGHVAACDVVAGWLRAELGAPSEPGLLANQASILLEEDVSIGRVSDLAGRLHVSTRTLERAVRRCTGFTPGEMLRRRRLQEAADRLARGPAAALATVASETGFADHSHMTREFRAAVSEPPSRLRDS
jgi:transcriptional regulator GlxA family with amidase domain